MQNRDTGEMQPISASMAEKLKALSSPPCIIQIGELVELKGGTFRVAAIGRRFVRLEGVPGTKVEGNYTGEGGE